MVKKPTSQGIHLTADDVRQWIKERDAITAKIEAAMVLLPDSVKADLLNNAAETSTGNRPKETYRVAILTALDDFPEGATHAELRAALEEESPTIAERMKRSANGFYNAVTKLENRDEVVKRGGWIYLAEQYERLVQAHGVDWEGFENKDDSASVPDAIRSFMDKRPDGAEAHEVRDALAQDIEIKEKLNKNSQYIYTALSRLAKRGELRKVGRRYFPKHKTETPPKTGGAQKVTGEVTASPNAGSRPATPPVPDWAH